MAPGYDVDDDVAHLHLPHAGNGNAAKAVPIGTIDDELFTRVLPRVDTAAIDEARNAFGDEDEDDDDSDGETHRPRRGRSLSESSTKEPPIVSYPELDTAVSAEGIESNRPSRPVSRGDLFPQHYSHARPDKDVAAAPARGPSRSDRASTDASGRIASRRDHDIPQRPLRAEEIEAARRILAQAAESDHYSLRATSPRGGRSATPPPIDRPRWRVIYESDEEEEDEDLQDDNHDYHDELRDFRDDPREGGLIPTPVTAIHLPTGDASPPPAASHNRQARSGRTTSSRVSSRQSSLPPPASRAAGASLAAHKREIRTPVLDHSRLYQDAEPPPISQRRPDQSRTTHWTTSRKLAEMEEEHFHDYSVKDASATGRTPDYRPATSGRRAASDDAMSISRQSTSKHSIASNGSAQRMVDFFGPGIFQVVLHNPTTSHQLLKFAEGRFCSESVEFLKKVEQYQTTLNDLAGIMTSIHKDFLSESSSKQININGEMGRSVHTEMKSIFTKTLPSMESLFTDLQESVEQDVFLDIYPRFVRFQMALNATRALATNRHSYQGLGDCFCLTNPAAADNPIVFASDGFVKVTGYSRSEIIPRNCRFLQGAHTDRQPIRRLKTAIEERKESVELILNYKKNGDPFWNLLYVAPLYNEAGKLAFFIGGQINCSTTIHSNVDVMRVLSTSNQDEAQDETKNKPPAPLRREGSLPSARKSFLKALGVRVDDDHGGPNGVAGEAGMENKLLQRMEGQGIGAQMREFYTAYSKYLVLGYDSFVVRFYSEGVMEMLHPANNTIGLVAGQEVFRFLKQNMVSHHQPDYKTKVRSAMRAGLPVSVELRLQTRRSALFRGDERFVTHWTPLKDEKSAVRWVVLTMAPTIS